MTEFLWKGVAAALLALLLAVGIGWWLAAGDRDQALAELKAEQGVSAELRTSIREQNRATDVLAKAKEAADARGALAQQLAAANGKRFDAAVTKLAGAKATTCADAMPYVNQVLEAVQ